MKQTGTFYTLTNNESGTEVKKPFPNIFLYFSQKGVRKLTTQTNASGKFDFDLPLGNYNVTMSMGANSTVHTLAGGSEFSLTSSSKVNAFEQWAMTPVYLKPEENPLVIRLAELAKIATDAATEAKEIQDAMNKGSTGTGKWVKESLIANMMNVGDFGVGARGEYLFDSQDPDAKGGLYAAPTPTNQVNYPDWFRLGDGVIKNYFSDSHSSLLALGATRKRYAFGSITGGVVKWSCNPP